MDKATEMISRAKKVGLAMTSHFSRQPALDKAYTNALKRGVKIRMLGTSPLDDSKRARASWYSNQGADIRILPLDSQITVGMVDNSEVCMRIDNNSLDSDVIWSNNPAMLNIFSAYFKELWSRAKKFKRSN